MAEGQERIVEPLAKFHAQVYKNGRISLPSHERKYFGIGDHDIVELIVRKIEEGKIIGRGWFLAQLTVKGRLTIPQGLREELNINDGDFVEVLLLGFIHVEDVLGKEGIRIIRAIRSNEYKLISDEDEKRLLSMIGRGIYHMLYFKE